MDVDNTVRMLRLNVSQEQLRAMRYLQRAKQVFCVHFGYDNALEKARDHWLALRRKRYHNRKA